MRKSTKIDLHRGNNSSTPRSWYIRIEKLYWSYILLHFPIINFPLSKPNSNQHTSLGHYAHRNG